MELYPVHYDTIIAFKKRKQNYTFIIISIFNGKAGIIILLIRKIKEIKKNMKVNNIPDLKSGSAQENPSVTHHPSQT